MPIRRQFRDIRCPHCAAPFSAGPAACPHGAANCEFPTCAVCHGRGLRISIVAIAFAVVLGALGAWMLRVYFRAAEHGDLGGQDRSLISAFALTLGGAGFAARQLLWPWCDHCKGSGRASRHGHVALYFLKRPPPPSSAPPSTPSDAS